MSDIEKLRAALKDLNAEYAKIKTIPPEERGQFGREMNEKKQKLLAEIACAEEAAESANIEPLDVSAPTAPNQPLPNLHLGTRHPLMEELNRVASIYANMGFDIMEPFQLDDEFHMFDSLNFPQNHPARDGYDTFRTAEGFIPLPILPPCNIVPSRNTSIALTKVVKLPSLFLVVSSVMRMLMLPTNIHFISVKEFLFLRTPLWASFSVF